MIARLFSPMAAKILLSAVGALLIALGMARCTIDRQAERITELKADVAKVRGVLDQANENHRLTKANFRQAMTDAEKLHIANLARIADQQAIINERTRDAHQARRAAADAAFARLRTQSRSGLARDAGHPDLAAISEAACRTHAGTGCEELPALLKAAQDNTDQLLGLQAWVRDQLAVPLASPPQ